MTLVAITRAGRGTRVRVLYEVPLRGAARLNGYFEP